MMAGELNKSITFQRKTITYDTYNAPIETWADSFTVWAAVAEIGSRELYQAQKLFSETSAVFKVRYTEKINSRMRIRYRGRTYEILGEPTPDSRRIELTISAKAVS